MKQTITALRPALTARTRSVRPAGFHRYNHHPKRYALVRRLRTFPVLIVGAILVTAGLFVLMQSLISDEFLPQDTAMRTQFEINPTVEETPLLIDRHPPELLESVETPPAPPVIDIPKTVKPSEPYVTTSTVIVPRPPLQLDIPTRFVAIDRDPEPIVRTPPAMPRRADRSGHCLVNFDISADGKPYNVIAQFCSQSLFERAALQAVQRWTYRPKRVEGVPVLRTGLQTRITFNLTDERGNLIPE